MCNWGTTKMLKVPDGLYVDRHWVSVDECIVPVIQLLFDNKIKTQHCCCGHGKNNPDLIVNRRYSDEECKEIVELIASIDNREWDILRWELVKYDKTTKI